MKYKVGDKVRIVGIPTITMNSSGRMYWLERIMTIKRIGAKGYRMWEDGQSWVWTDDMIAGKVEEEKHSSDYYLFKYLSAKLSEKEAELNAKLSKIKKIQEEIQKVLDNES